MLLPGQLFSGLLYPSFQQQFKKEYIVVGLTAELSLKGHRYWLHHLVFCGTADSYHSGIRMEQR